MRDDHGKDVKSTGVCSMKPARPARVEARLPREGKCWSPLHGRDRCGGQDVQCRYECATSFRHEQLEEHGMSCLPENGTQAIDQLKKDRSHAVLRTQMLSWMARDDQGNPSEGSFKTLPSSDDGEGDEGRSDTSLRGRSDYIRSPSTRALFPLLRCGCTGTKRTVGWGIPGRRSSRSREIGRALLGGFSVIRV